MMFETNAERELWSKVYVASVGSVVSIDPSIWADRAVEACRMRTPPPTNSAADRLEALVMRDAFRRQTEKQP